MNALPSREGYRLWAPTYHAETAVSHLENLTVCALEIPTAGRTLLDVGCGTARRLSGSGAALAAGVDLTIEMLAAAPSRQPLAAADVRALPFSSESFDVVWCRLVIGHVQDPETAYAELARVCRPGGAVVVSDLCPEAIAAGHRRTFRDVIGARHELEHFIHSAATHAHSAESAGLLAHSVRDGVVGENIREYYLAAGRMDAYAAQLGQSVVRAFAWRKTAGFAAAPSRRRAG